MTVRGFTLSTHDRRSQLRNQPHDVGEERVRKWRPRPSERRHDGCGFVTPTVADFYFASKEMSFGPSAT
jgi:hypothetical protein